MLDQIFALSRKAGESWLQIQQVFYKQLTEGWLAISPTTVGLHADWAGSVKKRLNELTIEMLTKQRETIDASYRLGIQTIEEIAKISEAKSAESWFRAVEGAWQQSFDTVKSQMDTQLREFQNWATKSFEVAAKANT